ncbi:MAG TPA: DUF6232 family protein [Bacteroidia bacterium]|nr:DUF6232 family protein [Bacteroidia bacterium]
MESTIYTDGHGVKVTNSEFITGKTSYKLEGIVNANTSVIRASAAPPILLILLGIVGILTGLLHFYSSEQISSLSQGSLIMTANRFAVIAGFVLLITGVMWSFRLRDKYAVHIVTAEGHKEPVISKKKDYVNQIVMALQKALKWK